MCVTPSPVVQQITHRTRRSTDTECVPSAAKRAMSFHPRCGPDCARVQRVASRPHEYYDLRGILSPIGDTERQCSVTALPPNLESAFHEFMAG